MRKHIRHKADGGTSAMETGRGKPQEAMRGNFKKSPSEILGRGEPDAMRSGNKPAQALSLGRTEARREGPSSKSIALGAEKATVRGPLPSRALNAGRSLANRSGIDEKKLSQGKPMCHGGKYAQGGKAVDMGFESKDTRPRLARRRDAILEEPAFKKGGSTRKGMKDMYEALHGKLEKEPYMQKLKATKRDVYDGEPHRATKMHRMQRGKR